MLLYVNASRYKPFWLNRTTWCCPAHLPSAKIPHNGEKCWYTNCNAVRPDESLRPKLQ